MTIPTVKIRSDRPKGYRIINASDFDATRHVLFDAQPAPAKRGPGRPPKAKPNEGKAE